MDCIAPSMNQWDEKCQCKMLLMVCGTPWFHVDGGLHLAPVIASTDLANPVPIVAPV